MVICAAGCSLVKAPPYLGGLPGLASSGGSFYYHGSLAVAAASTTTARAWWWRSSSSGGGGGAGVGGGGGSAGVGGCDASTVRCRMGNGSTAVLARRVDGAQAASTINGACDCRVWLRVCLNHRFPHVLVKSGKPLRW